MANRPKLKKAVSLPREPAQKIEPGIKVGTASDPLLATVALHEAEIARLQGVILDLRSQEVKWAQGQLGERPVMPRPPAPPSVQEELDAARHELDTLRESLSAAWTELDAKQSYLQAAVDDLQVAQVALEHAQAEAGAANAERDAAIQAQEALHAEIGTLRTQLEATHKRLSLALEVVARQSG